MKKGYGTIRTRENAIWGICQVENVIEIKKKQKEKGAKLKG
jgi:hypothetical protein